MKKKQKKEMNEIELFLIITLVICLGVGLLYGVSSLFLNNKKTEKPKYQTEEILIGQILNQEEPKYYVLIGDPNNIEYQTNATYLSNYSYGNGYAFYKVDIDSFLNKNHVAVNSHLLVTDIADLKVRDMTLLVIEDKKIAKVYEGNSNIYKMASSLGTK